MVERILIAGSGGQGVILTGKLLASVAVGSFEHITFFPAYGAEVRGGTSNCQVVLSSDEIASPVSDCFDAMLLLNEASAERFIDCIDPGGCVVVNTSMCRVTSRIGMVAVRATDEADRLGDQRVANLIMLGAYLRHHPVVPLAHVEQGVQQILAGKRDALIKLNLKALHLGFNYHEDQA
jgi:2-oxoglutarate ferredoxin oxidoreductase subunit gamma